MPRRAGARADEEGDVGPLECLIERVVDVHRIEKGEGRVVELHRRALGRFDGLRDLEQVQPDRSPFSEQGSRGDAEEKGVADVSGCTGDGDCDWRASHGVSFVSIGVGVRAIPQG